MFSTQVLNYLVLDDVFLKLFHNRNMRGRARPTKDDVRKSIMNSMWSPALYPAGIMQVHVTITSGVCHTPSMSMGFVPLNNVAPIFFPVKELIVFFVPKPSALVRVFPMALL